MPTKPIASSSSRGSIWRHNIEISASTSSRKNTPDPEDIGDTDRGDPRDTYQTTKCNAALKTFSYFLVIFRIKSVPTKPIVSSSSRGSIWRHNIEISASTSSRKNTPDSEDIGDTDRGDSHDYTIDPDNPCYNKAKPQYMIFWGFCVLLVG